MRVFQPVLWIPCVLGLSLATLAIAAVNLPPCNLQMRQAPEEYKSCSDAWTNAGNSSAWCWDRDATHCNNTEGGGLDYNTNPWSKLVGQVVEKCKGGGPSGSHCEHRTMNCVVKWNCEWQLTGANWKCRPKGLAIGVIGDEERDPNKVSCNNAGS